MESNHLMKVEVAYATKNMQLVIPVVCSVGSSAHTAIKLSGILSLFPEINLQQQKIGVFSQKVNLAHGLKDGDRVEIYRQLLIDPKDARRIRAEKQKN